MEHRDLISLREFIEAKLEHLSTRIDNVEAKFDIALLAQDKATQAAFAASEKAILKSEEGQKELNIKNNEFRGQLKDQAEHLMPRSESLANWRSVSEKVIELKEQTEIKLDLVRKEIQLLREHRSEGGGKSAGRLELWHVLLGAVSLIATVLSITAILIAFFRQ